MTLTFIRKIGSFSWESNEMSLQKETVMEDCKKEVNIIFFEKGTEIGDASKVFIEGYFIQCNNEFKKKMQVIWLRLKRSV